GPVVEVGETFCVASSGHEAPGEHHDRGNIRLWPADGLFQRIELEVGHDQPLGGHRARAGDEADADGDREHACAPVHGTHFHALPFTVSASVSTQKELTWIEITCTPTARHRQGYLFELTKRSQPVRL